MGRGLHRHGSLYWRPIHPGSRRGLSLPTAVHHERRVYVCSQPLRHQPWVGGFATLLWLFELIVCVDRLRCLLAWLFYLFIYSFIHSIFDFFFLRWEVCVLLLDLSAWLPASLIYYWATTHACLPAFLTWPTDDRLSVCFPAFAELGRVRSVFSNKWTNDFPWRACDWLIDQPFGQKIMFACVGILVCLRKICLVWTSFISTSLVVQW